MRRRSSNHPNSRRGQELRARMVAYLRHHADAGRPMPKHECIGQDFGISPQQVTRHLNRLMDAGILRVVGHGRVNFVEFPGKGEAA